MASLDVPNKYLAAAPIIVTSPTARCGTTLVQRLLTASDNAFIYGEQVGHEIRTLTDLFMAELRFVESSSKGLDADFEKALAGTLSDWRPGLAPPGSVLLKAWVETYYQVPTTLAHHAAAIGRPIWGFKFPAYSRGLINAIMSMMPRTRVIYVYRNPYDALKSAKARRFVNTNKDVATFCAQWATNTAECADLAKDERVLFLKYEDLIEQREAHLQRIEAFTGAKNMDLKAFDLKINTYAGATAQGHAPSQYIEPAELSKTDRAYVQNRAGAAMERFYGQMAQAA
jgi:hypothetical protein